MPPARPAFPSGRKSGQLARAYFEVYQNRDGGWGYTPQAPAIDRQHDLRGHRQPDHLRLETISKPGASSRRQRSVSAARERSTVHLNRGIDWLATHFDVHQNLGHGQQYKLYYLYGLERAGRLAGVRFFGQNDWYRLGAEELVRSAEQALGVLERAGRERDRGDQPGLVIPGQGARSGLDQQTAAIFPRGDWNNDADDVRNLVGVVSHEWKHLLTWQVVDPATATSQDMLQAPIAFFNGHDAPEFSARARQNLREFRRAGGLHLRRGLLRQHGFDRGFKQLMKEIFPEEEYRLRPLSPDHAVWRAKHLLSPEIHPLWGIEHGCRTVLIYSPQDLSCYWNQVERSPTNPAVIKAFRVGENVIDYATGREMPADKLTIREVARRPRQTPRGAGHCESPSSSTPANGTSPPRPSPT